MRKELSSSHKTSRSISVKVSPYWGFSAAYVWHVRPDLDFFSKCSCDFSSSQKFMISCSCWTIFWVVSMAWEKLGLMFLLHFATQLAVDSSMRVWKSGINVYYGRRMYNTLRLELASSGNRQRFFIFNNKKKTSSKRRWKETAANNLHFFFRTTPLRCDLKKTKKRKSVLYLFFANGNTRSRRSQGLVASVKKRRTKSRLPQRSRSLPCSLRSPKLMDFFRVW